MTDEITLYEVGPRDGLQNEPRWIPTELKLQFIRTLAQSGLPYIEATSFVSPQWVPQMKDHAAILEELDLTGPVRYPVLIPNLHGLERALQHKVKDIALITSASETFSQKNTNASISKSVHRIKEIASLARQEQLQIRTYVSCVMGCPYEHTITAEQVKRVTDQLFELGIDRIVLGDTTGVGTDKCTHDLLSNLIPNASPLAFAVHFHDTYGRALDNIEIALDYGIRTIDSSAGGLGGCPYAPGASGNVATERVIERIQSLGYQCSVDRNKISEAAALIRRALA